MLKRDKIIEIIATVILALASLLAAWSGYQASAWASKQATLALTVGRIRLESTRALTKGGQNQIVDVIVFTQWLEAANRKDQALADYYRARFRDEFKPAFEAWLKLDPANNPDAHTPFSMPEYAPEQFAIAGRLEAEADQAAERFQFANDISTSYVRNTLFIAIALFFGGIASRFDYRPVRIAMLVMAVIMLLTGIGNALSMPMTY